MAASYLFNGPRECIIWGANQYFQGINMENKQSTDTQAKDTRKLTKDEIKRTELFNKTTEDLGSQGYRRENITVSSGKANLFGILAGAVPANVLAVAFYISTNTIYGDIDNLWMFLAIPIFLASIIIHELLHGTGWILFTKGKFKSIAFGVVWKALMPYCTCKEPLRKGQYITGLLLPFIILGVIPGIFSCIFASFPLFIYSVMMMICAGGDLLIFFLIMKSKLKGDVLFLDHPTDVGLAAFVKG